MGAIEMESCVRAAVASPVGCMKYRLVVWLACSFIFDDFNTFYAVRTVIGSRQKHSHYFVVRTIVHVRGLGFGYSFYSVSLQFTKCE